MKSLAYEAMLFAREKHRDQRRKYTNQPYIDHLAEVAGIAMSVGWQDAMIHPDKLMAVAWLHDVAEDQNVSLHELQYLFGREVAQWVLMLSDLESGNRAERKRLSRDRLAKAPGWVQTVKVADLISNTSSIVQHDPAFAPVYLEEKRLLLDVMKQADPRLLDIAWQQIKEAILA